MTPGTAKRGKAIKTAVEMFLRDKATTLKEKELIKANLTKVIIFMLVMLFGIN